MIKLGALAESVDLSRIDAYRKLKPGHRAQYGQFFTPPSTARLMASMIQADQSSIQLLDPGAGIGALTAAFVSEICQRNNRPRELFVTAYELDGSLIEYLQSTFAKCRAMCIAANVRFNYEILQADFIEAAVSALQGSLFASKAAGFNCAILNPPYRKINSQSETRRVLRRVGIETTNFYTAFMALTLKLLRPGAEMVAITPRSFTNGPYFRPFRQMFLESMIVRRIHVFESREQAFEQDEILQENIIVHAIKSTAERGKVTISSSSGPDDDQVLIRDIDHNEFVRPGDPNLFFHIVPDELAGRITERMLELTATLDGLGLTVSTGRVVDFRAKDFLRHEPDASTVPLIYPAHFADGFIKWPKLESRKPNAIVNSAKTDDLLVPSGIYVLVKRFSAKEERRRIVAAIFDPARIPAPKLGFENHLNYYHINGGGLSETLAKGLAVFLNSTLVDAYFRHFNGHTQVNATDLRSLTYPTRAQLEALGRRVRATMPSQDDIDRLVQEELFPMAKKTEYPIEAKRKIEGAQEILKAFGLPKLQQNERSALTLLALLDLRSDMEWSESRNPRRGITPIMDFIAEHYGKRYAPNSRETVRRFTVHQFVAAALALQNMDNPARPTNSKDNVYEVEPTALKVIHSYGTDAWEANLAAYLSTIKTLRERYAQERAMALIPLDLPSGVKIELSPGGQNVLVEQIINKFCPRFTPGAVPLYVGDTAKKDAYYDREGLKALGVVIEEHGKMPDVLVYHTDKNWLVLIEAVTSHGPINPKRKDELKALFTGSTAGLVYVTAFLNRKTMAKYLDDIAWEAEVWVADNPDHIIHFNGERFLGPYDSL